MGYIAATDRRVLICVLIVCIGCVLEHSYENLHFETSAIGDAKKVGGSLRSTPVYKFR